MAANLALLAPAPGSVLSGFTEVVGQVNLNLDAAGSYLMVDGMEVGTRRATGPPFLFGLDTTTLPNGTHTLQIWAHTISNTTVITAPITVTVAN